MTRISQRGRKRQRLDWSHGPIPCAACQRPMRPSGSRPEGIWEGTRAYARHGICSTCDYHRLKHATKPSSAAGVGEAQPVGPQVTVARHVPEALDATDQDRFEWRWHLPDAAAEVPLPHLAAEAEGAMTRALRALRLVATSRADKRLVHGRHAHYRLVCRVRPMTDREAQALAAAGMPTGDAA